jgi:hypothetical protein
LKSSHRIFPAPDEELLELEELLEELLLEDDEDELLDDELEELLLELLLDDELLDEDEDELLEDEELVVPSHTPRLVYQPQLGQWFGGVFQICTFA